MIQFSFIISNNGWTKPVLKSFVSFTVFTWFAMNKQAACHATSNTDQHTELLGFYFILWVKTEKRRRRKEKKKEKEKKKFTKQCSIYGNKKYI